MRKFLLLTLLIPCCVCAKQVKQSKSLLVKETKEKIVLDGIMDEDTWAIADVGSDFLQYFPSDTSIAESQTEISMAYDQEFLYVAAKVIDKVQGPYTITSLRRDYRGYANDGVSLLFDTFKDRTNAFLFGLTPFGVQREALVSNGGTSGNFTLSWDNKWYSESKVYEGYWITEVAIPFKTLRFKEGATEWGFNSYRLDSKTFERSSLNFLPRNGSIYSLTHEGTIKFDKPLKKTGGNITLIPFYTSNVVKNHEAGGDAEFSQDVGGDAKIAVTSGLNLDLTLNPDFSQVEVDRQVTNLSRFEIFFPERRQFFIENGDLFGNLGSQTVRPFFSRRIGIATDTATNLAVQIPISFGARLSGKVNDNWRIGLLNTQTQGSAATGLNDLNYGVGVIQRKVGQRSNISTFFINKQNLFTKDVDRDFRKNNYDRLAGIEYNFLSSGNTWSGKVFYHQSSNGTSKGTEAFAQGAQINYSKRNFDITWNHNIVGSDFSAPVGFVPRTGYVSIAPEFRYRFFPKSKTINNHGPGAEVFYIWDNDLGTIDRLFEVNYRISFQNNAFIGFGLINEFTYLFSDFDPTNTGGLQLEEGNSFTYNRFVASYMGDTRRKVYGSLRADLGDYFNGTRKGLSGTLNVRYQPYGIFSLDFSYNRIDLPEPYADANLLLLGPRFDFTFSKKLFLTSFFQYNNQIDNFNVNARLQWRFKPVSDIFLVYSDNYGTESWKVKNRAIILKATYWLNL